MEQYENEHCQLLAGVNVDRDQPIEFEKNDERRPPKRLGNITYLINCLINWKR